jgi:hypothetical protein
MVAGNPGGEIGGVIVIPSLGFQVDIVNLISFLALAIAAGRPAAGMLLS